MTRQAEFNTQRTFGVEIEFLSTVERSLVARKLREAGVPAFEEGYNHENKNYWKIIRDGSCGNEAVSPILKGYEGLEQIKTVCKVMNQLHCQVNIKCGLHVHHGVGDYNIKHFKNLYIAYSKYENLLDSLMPNSRRKDTNTYCKSMLKNRPYNYIAEDISKCKTLDDIRNLYPSRYHKLNVQSYVKYGTIEFRQHSGTVEAEKIVNWVIFTQTMVERCKRNVQPAEEREYDHLGCLYNMLGIARKVSCSEEIFNVGKFYRARAKQLNKENRREAA